MRTSDVNLYRYSNSFSLGSKLARLLWNFVWAIFFRPGPSWCLNSWRVCIIKLFGAKCGKGCRISPSAKIWAPWNLRIGDYVCFGEGVDCYNVSTITVGSKVTISQRSFLCTASHDVSSLTRPLVHSPIRIKDHSWVCSEAFVGPGVTIGEGAVVGARSVVTKDVPAWSIVGGNPAKFIKRREIAKK